MEKNLLALAGKICSHCTYMSSKMLPSCARCNIMCYCSQECQKTDWPVHKLTCKQMAEKAEIEKQNREKDKPEWLKKL